MNKAAFGPGNGPIGFERLGAWRTSSTDSSGKGPPLVFAQGSYVFKSKYGVLYKITGSSGGLAGNTYSTNVGGYGGSGFQFWWVGDGNNQAITVGGASSTTSFGAIATATPGSAGGSAAGPAGGIYIGGIPPGQGLAGGCSGYFFGFGGCGPFGLGAGGRVDTFSGNGLAGTGYGAGGGGGTSPAAGQPGVLIIEIVPPLMNSQDGAWESQL